MTRRGFSSERAARDVERRLVEQVERGEVRHTIGEHWERWLARRKAYLEPGTWRAYDVDGRKRLLPAFASIPLGRLGTEQVRAWLEEQAEAVDGEEIAPKTVNNTGAERYQSDAHFARLAGVAPIPVSSGRTDRHRLDRGGNRQLNRALHVIAITRGRLDPATRAYLQRKEAEVKTRIETMRCLKRHHRPALPQAPATPRRSVRHAVLCSQQALQVARTE